MLKSKFEAVYSEHHPIEAGLYDEIRRRATAYSFAFSTDLDGVPVEGAEVWFAWNEEGLYVAAELEDSLLVSENRRDEQLHYQFGDLFELFVKPANETYCWEMYATPFGNKSTLFFPDDDFSISLDDLLHAHDDHGLEVTAEETSAGWKAQLWVPAEQLKSRGESWGPGSEWCAFCGRYNYNNTELANPELSMVPALSATNYHLIDEYAPLRFLEQEI